jgi:flavin-dependent dehydrogenase
VNEIDADVVVIGGGPAGASIASRLAKQGYAVVVIEASEFPRPHVGESLHAHVASLFDQLGLREQIESSGFLRPQAALVHWAGETRSRRDVANGYQVDRARFDKILLQAATQSGAQIIQPARVVTFEHLAERQWRLTVATAGEQKVIRTPFLVDASGRRGYLPGRRAALQPATLALYAYWHNTGLEGAETRIEAGTEHWYWAAPLPDGSVNATVFVSPERCRNKGASSLKEHYLQLLDESQLLSECLRGQLKTTVRACSATASRVLEPIGTDWIKIGEAALAYDPLSSQGVQNAMSSGLQGAAVVNTLLSDPAAQQLAINFYRNRIDEAARQHAETAANFYWQQAQCTPLPFWLDRSQKRKPTEPPIAKSLADLKWHTILRLNPQAVFQPTAVLIDNRIVQASALSLPERSPVVWIEGVLISELFSDSLQHFESCSAATAVTHWSRRMEAERAVQILKTLWREDFIVDAAQQPSDQHVTANATNV